MVRLMFRLWILLTCCAFANGGGPDQAVVLIDKLRFQDEVDWNDFLIADRLDEDQLRALKKRVEEEIESKLKHHYSFSLLSTKKDVDVGGAVVQVSDPSNPMHVQVIGMSFCKVGEQWKATPLMGSFDYTGFKRFDMAAELRQSRIEKWLYQERVRELARLEKADRERFRKRVAERLEEDSPLFDGTREEAVLYFLELCRRKDLLGVAGCLGLDGIVDREALTGVRLSLIDGIGGGKLSGGWNNLVNRAFLAEPMKEVDGDGGKVSIAMYFAQGKTPEQILECQVGKAGERWVIRLPQSMLLTSSGGFPGSEFQKWRLTQANRLRLNTVTEVIMKGVEAKRSASPDDLVSRLKGALDDFDFRLWCELGSFSGESEDDRKAAFESYARSWRELHESTNTAFRLLHMKAEDGVAVCRLLAYSRTRPNVYDLFRLNLLDDKSGWYHVTDYHLEEMKEGDERRKTYRVLEDEAASKERDLKRGVAKDLLGESLVIGEEVKPVFSLRDKTVIRGIYNGYEKALEQGGYLDGLRYVAVIEGNETELLSAVGADLRGRNDEDAKYEVLGEHVSEVLGGITVRVSNSRTSDVEYFLYGVHQVGQSYYLMPTVLYRYEFGRGDRLLNRDLQTGFGKAFGGRYAESLADLIQQHNKLVDGVLKK